MRHFFQRLFFFFAGHVYIALLEQYRFLTDSISLDVFSGAFVAKRFFFFETILMKYVFKKECL